jgi:hypothetical protein
MGSSSQVCLLSLPVNLSLFSVCGFIPPFTQLIQASDYKGNFVCRERVKLL